MSMEPLCKGAQQQLMKDCRFSLCSLSLETLHSSTHGSKGLAFAKLVALVVLTGIAALLAFSLSFSDFSSPMDSAGRVDVPAWASSWRSPPYGQGQGWIYCTQPAGLVNLSQSGWMAVGVPGGRHADWNDGCSIYERSSASPSRSRFCRSQRRGAQCCDCGGARTSCSKPFWASGGTSHVEDGLGAFGGTLSRTSGSLRHHCNDFGPSQPRSPRGMPTRLRDLPRRYQWLPRARQHTALHQVPEACWWCLQNPRGQHRRPQFLRFSKQDGWPCSLAWKR